MKIVKDIKQRSEEWEKLRIGKITGTRVKDLIPKRGKVKKMAFYEIIAEKMCIDEEYENPMDRGSRLESKVIELFEEETGKTVEEVAMCISDFNEDIALSPDGLIKNNGEYTEAIEIKCLKSSEHIKSYLTKEIPSTYKDQALQYFVVNEKLETLYFCMYDPRLPYTEFFYIEMKRWDYEEDIKTYKEYQENTLKEINEIIEKLTF